MAKRRIKIKKKTTRWVRALKLDHAKAAKLRPTKLGGEQCRLCGGRYERVRVTDECSHKGRRRWMPEDDEQSSEHICFARDFDGTLKVLPSDEETRIGDI